MKPKSQVLKRIDGIENNVGSMSGECGAVVIENADVPKFIKSYTEIEVTDEYKIVQCASDNQIIAQGMILFKWGSVAPNGVTIKRLVVYKPSQLPDIPFYTDVDFYPYSAEAVYINDRYVLCEIKGVSINLRSSEIYNGAIMNTYQVTFKTYERETGKPSNYNDYFFNTKDGFAGVTFAWRGIYPPDFGYKMWDGNIQKFKFGYALVIPIYKLADGGYYYLEDCTQIPLPFASMNEYNAAVSLTSVS